LVVVGDINSSPDDELIIVPQPTPPGFPPVIVPPYTQLVESGYTDAWTLRPGDLPGYTCCQEDDLSNRGSEHGERIDTIFSLDSPSQVKKARVLGSRVADKTPPPGIGLWPSDHGVVAAELSY
jgi:exonuclease III